MSSESSSPERRLSKFSNAERAARLRQNIQNEEPLANLLEHVMRDGPIRGADRRSGSPPSENGSAEELNASLQVPGEDSLATRRIGEEIQAALDGARFRSRPQILDVLEPGEDLPHRPIAMPPETKIRSVARGIRFVLFGAGRILARTARLLGRAGLSFGRQMRLSDWRRRRLALLSLAHRHIFDRRIEALLFSKTPTSRLYNIQETERGKEKTFVYRGPMPSKVLEWALSALPSDLKHYAFVDFWADHGRTLLLATRRNFEYAAGYAFSQESRELLEMNLAQYPRSYMSCRDVRALRGDREGVVIPPQPAVLFLPDSLSRPHRDIILSHIAASYRLDPRPIYLIVENFGRDRTIDHMDMFERAPLPILNRLKVALFSTGGIAIFRSLVTGSKL